MAKYGSVKAEFDALSQNNAIGDSNGKLAYAYIRVSSEEQAEEGKSGLPRQILHIHEVAKQHGLRITWDMVFADDHSGFEFEERPQLTQLRREIIRQNRRANAIVIEHIDRLSRNADWHQGFLLDEMKRFGIEPFFWKPFSSRIERAVLGIVAQDAMEQAKQRMAEGNLYKARSGRVTARTPAYGYKLVDSNGETGERAKKETYYAINEDEARVVRRIFQQALAGKTLRGIAVELEEAGIKPPKQSRHWEATQVRLFIRNEVYKGDYYAHRWIHTIVQKLSKDGYSTRNVQHKIERPREEWIHVPVPPLVSVEEWEAANRMLEQNKKMARRNAHEPYLLTGLVRCAHCGWRYAGSTRLLNRHGNPRRIPLRIYRCPNQSIRPKFTREHEECKNSHIHCHFLDGIVWNIVIEALLEPKMLLAALDADAVSQRNVELSEQIAFLEREVATKRDDDERLLRAYLAQAFDEHEYSSRRKLLKVECAKLTDELALLRSQVLTVEQLEERKQTILSMSQAMRSHNIALNPPFELKQRILKLVVDEIIVNVSEGWLKLHGAIRGVCHFDQSPMKNSDQPINANHTNSQIETIPADMGSSRPQAGS